MARIITTGTNSSGIPTQPRTSSNIVTSGSSPQPAQPAAPQPAPTQPLASPPASPPPVNLGGDGVTGQLPLSKLAQSGAAPGQVPVWGASGWAPGDVTNGGVGYFPMVNADVDLSTKTYQKMICPVSGLTAQHTFILPDAPFLDQTIEVPVIDGSMNQVGGHTVAFNGGDNSIQGPTAAGTTYTTTYVADPSWWGGDSVGGPTITIKWIGNLWKVV